MPDSNLRSFDEMFQAAGVKEETKAEPIRPPDRLDMGQLLGESYKESENQNVRTDDIGGRIPNGLNGFMAGGLAGAGIGMALPPSANPGMDTGATLGETAMGTAMDRLFPGAGKMAKIGANMAGVGLGGFLGHQVDKLANPDHQIETPTGPIMLYMGASAAGLAASSVMARPTVLSAMRSKADQLKTMTGVDYPLSISESRGGGALSKLFTHGSVGERELGEAQNAAAQRAFNKITGSTWDNLTANVEGGLASQKAMKGNYSDWKSANATETVTATGERVAGKPDWNKLVTDFSLSPEERQAFFDVVRTKPEVFIDKFVTSSESQMKGLFGLRAMKKFLAPEEFAPLGKALVFRVLDKNGAFTETANGLVLSGEKFEQALFQKFGEDRLKLALGKETTDALKTLAVIMKDADPARKLSQGGQGGQAGATIGYAANKAMFTLASVAGAATIGTQVGAGNFVAPAVGAGVGMAVGVPLYNMVSKIMTSPHLAKGLYEATHGNTTAASKVIRMIVAPKETDHTETPSKPSSRIPLFPAVP